jgi:hypothetical protein
MNRTRLDGTVAVTAAFIVFSLLCQANAWAFIGKVSSFKGEVIVTADGRIERMTQPGVLLNDGDMVQVKNGEAQVTFNDGALLKISPFSQTMIQERQEQSGVWIFKTLQHARRVTCLVGKLWFKSGTPGTQNFLQTPTAVAGIRGSDGDFGYDNQRSFLNMYSGEAAVVGAMVRGLFQEPGITAAQRNAIFQRVEQVLAMKAETDKINAATPSNSQKALNTSSVVVAILNIARDVSTLIASSNPDPAARQQAQLSLALANTKIATAEAMAAAAKIGVSVERATESATKAKAAGDAAAAAAAEQAAAQARAAATLAQGAVEAAQRAAADAAQGVVNGSLTLVQVENSARIAASIAAVVDAAAGVAGSAPAPGSAGGAAYQQAASVVSQQLVAVTQAAQGGDAARAQQAAQAAVAAAQTTMSTGQSLGAAGAMSSQADQTALLKAIAADVAAGGDIAAIIANAVAAGMTVAEAVEAIVAAGADPGRVAYLAITANFSAADVVAGAAAAVTKMGMSDAVLLAQMTTIISTARQAGASESQVNGALSAAGIPATVIANANVAAAQTPAPVYGYTAPAPPAEATTAVIGAVGGGGVSIGGASIGAPPTQPASPTKPQNQR